MNIHKNFLSEKDFKEIEQKIMSAQMPWYFNEGVNNIQDEHFQFTFTFLNEQGINCSKEMLNTLNPILDKLKYKKINRIKANLLIKDNKIIEHGMHIDQPKGKTGIFYINTCNGYTKFKNGEKIKSEKNKYVEFDSILEHTGSSCTDEKRRVVINFNYELN